MGDEQGLVGDVHEFQGFVVANNVLEFIALVVDRSEVDVEFIIQINHKSFN